MILSKERGHAPYLEKEHLPHLLKRKLPEEPGMKAGRTLFSIYTVLLLYGTTIFLQVSILSTFGRSLMLQVLTEIDKSCHRSKRRKDRGNVHSSVQEFSGAPENVPKRQGIPRLLLSDSTALLPKLLQLLIRLFPTISGSKLISSGGTYANLLCKCRARLRYPGKKL